MGNLQEGRAKLYASCRERGKAFRENRIERAVVEKSSGWSQSSEAHRHTMEGYDEADASGTCKPVITEKTRQFARDHALELFEIVSDFIGAGEYRGDIAERAAQIVLASRKAAP